MTGRLVGVVGPSGAGKDTLMVALAKASSDFSIVRRVITRAPELGGEDYEPVDEATFLERKSAGAFCIQWQAHGLHYGIPVDTVNRIADGESMLVNLSRSVLSEVAAVIEPFLVLNVTAEPEILAGRLARRGRESDEEIKLRLDRKSDAVPDGLSVVTVKNNGTIEEAMHAALQVLQPVRA